MSLTILNQMARSQRIPKSFKIVFNFDSRVSDLRNFATETRKKIVAFYT